MTRKETAIEYTIYEQPQPPSIGLSVLENPTADKPILENPTLDNPTSEISTQLNKELLKTKYEKRKIKYRCIKDPFHSFPFPKSLSLRGRGTAAGTEAKGELTDAYSVYEEVIKDNIEYDYLIQDRYLDRR